MGNEYLLVGGPKHGQRYAIEGGDSVAFNADAGGGVITKETYRLERCEFAAQGGSMRAEVTYLRHSEADVAESNGYALMAFVTDAIAFMEQQG